MYVTVANVSSDAIMRQIAERALIAQTDGVYVRAVMQKFAANVVAGLINHVAALYALRHQTVQLKKNMIPIRVNANVMPAKVMSVTVPDIASLQVAVMK